MNTEMNVKINYVGFTRRTVAAILDQIIFFLPLIVLYIVLSVDNEIDNSLDKIAQY